MEHLSVKLHRAEDLAKSLPLYSRVSREMRTCVVVVSFRHNWRTSVAQPYSGQLRANLFRRLLELSGA